MHRIGIFGQRWNAYMTVVPSDYNEAEKFLSPHDILLSQGRSAMQQSHICGDAGVNNLLCFQLYKSIAHTIGVVGYTI